MPCQVSSQLVATKSQKLVHVLGLEAVAAVPSAAHASALHTAPAAARIVAATVPSLVMRASLAPTWRIVTWERSLHKPDSATVAPQTAMALTVRTQVASAPQWF